LVNCKLDGLGRIKKFGLFDEQERTDSCFYKGPATIVQTFSTLHEINLNFKKLHMASNFEVTCLMIGFSQIFRLDDCLNVLVGCCKRIDQLSH
jgi:hypothetical protein